MPEPRYPSSASGRPEVSVPEAGQRIARMSDPELLRFAMVAKYNCALEAQLGQHATEPSLRELREAKKEWMKRFPTLPLSASFAELNFESLGLNVVDLKHR